MRIHEILGEAVTTKPVVLYHGTDSDAFDGFDPDRAAKGSAHYNPLGQGLYATDSVHMAKKFGAKVHRVTIPAGASYKRITMRQWADSVGRNIVMTALKKALATQGIDLGRKKPTPRNSMDWDATDDAKAQARDFYAELPEILGGAVPYKGLKDAADTIANHFDPVIAHEVRQALPATSNAVFSAYDFVIFTDTLDAGTGRNGKSALEVVITNPALQRTQAMTHGEYIDAHIR